MNNMQNLHQRRNGAVGKYVQSAITRLTSSEDVLGEAALFSGENGENEILQIIDAIQALRKKLETDYKTSIQEYNMRKRSYDNVDERDV